MDTKKIILLSLACVAVIAAIVLTARPAKGKGLSLTYTA